MPLALIVRLRPATRYSTHALRVRTVVLTVGLLLSGAAAFASSWSSAEASETTASPPRATATVPSAPVPAERAALASRPPSRPGEMVPHASAPLRAQIALDLADACDLGLCDVGP